MVREPQPKIVARDHLENLLAGLDVAGSFCAGRTVRPDDLHIEVRGVGPLRLPVPKAQARQLIRVARPARYGLGAATLLDPRVRDTWEVPKSRVKIDQRCWNKTLLPVLDQLRADLGLPAGCRLKAELHSMLVYAPGQFFVPHQDTEKSDGMVGSLVVTLPAPFTGGGLVVDHGAERATYRSSKDRLSCVAFYADCRHEIKPVRSGYRIVLTYNLSVLGDTAGTIPEVAGGTVDALAACVQEHFSTPVPPPSWRRDEEPSPPPVRLVYLLDHEYTERGVSGTHLKGVDAVRAVALRAAAELADCEVVLALADISETWSAYEFDRYDRPSWRAQYRRWDDDEDGDDEHDDVDHGGEYELEELIESSISLDHWTDWSGERAERILSSVGDDELCATTPTNQFEPYASEYEPYMGNYGNTLDRQYRRAALVLWPRQRTFAVRAEASPLWALGEVGVRLKAGTVDEARQMVRMLEPFWPTAARGEQRGLFARAVRVAAGLDDPELATALLAPFRLEMVSKGDAAGLAALADRYGDRWLAAVVARWSGGDRYWGSAGDRAPWVAALPPLCTALHARGSAGTTAALLLVGEAHRWLAGAVESRCRIERCSVRDDALKKLARPVLGLLESTAVVGAPDVRVELLRLVCGDGDDMLLRCLIEVVRAGSKLDAPVRAAAGLDAIAEHCVRFVEGRLARPPRAEGDWSIDLPGGCDCELCGTLGTFLADAAERAREWPLAQDRRRHVHSRIDASELPVRHQTRRSGRPYTLVLTKTTDLFEREAKQRRRDEADLRWLRTQLGRRRARQG